MKRTIVFLTALTIVLSKTRGQEEDTITSIYIRCKEETQAEENEMEEIGKMGSPTTSKGKCMMGCLMREAFVIVDGKFNKEGAIDVAQRYYSDNPEHMDKAYLVIDTCEKQIEYEAEECELAGKLASCVIDEAQKNGLPFFSNDQNMSQR